MSSALIGHTGFVGSNLLRQHSFEDRFNSTNIEQMRGKSYDLVVCAGVRAEKWKANRDPEGDRIAIERLRDTLVAVRASKFILISTVDVYPTPIEVDESTPIDSAIAQPYGKHRFELEQFVVGRFDCHVVRLPGLFGEGLKKNIVFDLIHGNQLANIHSESVYQFYDLGTIWRDVQTATNAALPLVNFATEPVSVREVAKEVFDLDFRQAPRNVAPARYDMRTRHAALYGGEHGYLRNKSEVLSAMKTFVAAVRAGTMSIGVPQ